MSPSVSVNGTVKSGNESEASTSITGVSEEYLDLKRPGGVRRQAVLASIRNICQTEKVCVIGYYLAVKLYGGASKRPGQTLRSMARPTCEIVGCVGARPAMITWMRGGSDVCLHSLCRR